MPIARIGQEFILNTTAANDQMYPALTTLSDGRFIATWASQDTGDGSAGCIRGRIFNGDGAPAGGDFVVNTTASLEQYSPTVAALANGRFVVTWESYDLGDSSSTCVRGRVFNADGTAGNDFVLNSTGTAAQLTPAVTALESGGFAATWVSADQSDGSGTCIRARIFNANGVPMEGDFIVNNTGAGSQYRPAITALSNGRFLVTWDSADTGDGSGLCIRGRIYKDNGDVAHVNNGADFVIDTTAMGEQRNPSATALSGGRFVVTWESFDGGDGSGGCVRGRVFNADATAANDFILNSSTYDGQYDPVVTALADGRFVVTWGSFDGGDGSLGCIRGRVFNIDGSADGSDFVGNATGAGGQFTPAITALPDGRFVVAWQSTDAAADGSASCVRAQILDPKLFTGTLFGDVWQGGNLNDVIRGGGGGDTLSGRDGNDLIDGGTGNDTLAGGFGDDVFVYRPGGAADTIIDFNAILSGNDKIDLTAFSGIRNFADVLARATQIGLDTVVSFGNGDILILKNVVPAELGADDFIFNPRPSNDFSGEGRSDILWRHGDGTVVTWLTDGAGSFTSQVLGGPDGSWHIAETGDFNRDGKSDILWRNDDGTVVSWLMNGSGVGATQTLGAPDNSWHVAETGDFNGDSRSDILWRNDDGTVVTWLMNEISGMLSQVVGNPGAAWHVNATGDFNADGRDDILWRHDDGTVVAWLMNEVSGMTTQTLGNPGSAWQVEAAGDFNADGRDDILWRNDDGTVLAFLLDSNGGFGALALAAPDNTWHIESADDFNGDGRTDVLWRNDDGTVSTWLLDGNGSFTSVALVGPEAAWQIQNDPTGIL